MHRLLPLLSALLVLSLSGCSVIQQVMRPPTVRFDRAVYRAADFEALRADIILDVTNNNPLGAKLDGYDLRFVVDGLTLLDGSVQQGVDLSPGQATEVTLPVIIKWAEVADKLSKTGGKLPADLPWKATGEVRFATPIGSLSVPLNINGKLPVLTPPLIKPTAVRLTAANPLAPGIEIDFAVQNPNGRAVDLSAFRPSLTLQGQSIATGELSGGSVTGGASSTRTLALTLNPIQIGVSLVSAITSGGKVEVRATGDVDVDTGFGVVPMSFDSSSGLRVLR